jgi:outer membrane protein assembly factor BamB
VFHGAKKPATAAGTAKTVDGDAEAILSGRRIVVAVSGKSGRELWKHRIEQDPVDFSRESLERGTTMVRQPSGSAIAVVDGPKWFALDPATGRTKGPAIEFGFVPAQPVQYADVDGDGSLDLLALEPGTGPQPLTIPILRAFSLATGKRLWSEKLMAYFKLQPGISAPPWILPVDFDGDGSVEIAVPDDGALPPPASRIFAGVRLLDGRTGRTRWVAPLWPGVISESDSVAHLLAAPDLDADGARDLVVLSHFSGRDPYTQFAGGNSPEPRRVFVDALSGKDGRHLWEWHTDLVNAEHPPIGPAFWWGEGPDGWPLVAVPIGGSAAPGVTTKVPSYAPDPPVVHLLAASTGTFAHTIDGLSWPKTDDLDGDGLADLWGSVDNQLRAFRANAPEAWRALGGLQPAGDLDGDGMNDVVSHDLEPLKTSWGSTKTESRTVLARSGRDGRLLWRSRLDPWEDWFFWGEWTRAYWLRPLTLPHGDLDGDGCADILVRRGADGPAMGRPESLSLPVRALSGRTGRLLWSARPLGLALRDTTNLVRGSGAYIEGMHAQRVGPRGRPDVIVLYNLGFSGGPMGRRLDQQVRLALLSGQDGRVVWDNLITDHQGGASQLNGFIHEFADLDGDGGRELVLLRKSKAAAGPSTAELRAISLVTGQTSWSHALNPDTVQHAVFAIGDLDSDGDVEVVVKEHHPQHPATTIVVSALDGRTGKPLWSWRGDAGSNASDPRSGLFLADLEGKGAFSVCVSSGIGDATWRIVVLDCTGKPRVSHDLKATAQPLLKCTDLDGDGRDDLLLQDADWLRAWRGDLNEIWSARNHKPLRELLPASKGRAATVVLDPSLGLDGATGRPIWSLGSATSLIKSSGTVDPPRGLEHVAGATIERAAAAAADDGAPLASGQPAKPATLGDDPRWERALPWAGPVEPYANPLVQLAMGATIVNVCIPLAILWLATRRRFWSLRLLLALPAMVAFPLVGYQAVNSFIPGRVPPGAPWWTTGLAVAMLSVSGIPVVVFMISLTAAVFRRQWPRIAFLLFGAFFAAALIAAFMLWRDSLAKPLIEHYDWMGWHRAIYFGVYLAGGLVILGRLISAAGRTAMRWSAGAGLWYPHPPHRRVGETHRA